MHQLNLGPAHSQPTPPRFKAVNTGPIAKDIEAHLASSRSRVHGGLDLRHVSKVGRGQSFIRSQPLVGVQREAAAQEGHHVGGELGEALLQGGALGGACGLGGRQSSRMSENV